MRKFFIAGIDLPRVIFDWVIVKLHCLTHPNEKEHGLNKFFISLRNPKNNTNRIEKYYFCSCGFMVKEMPDDLIDYANLLSKVGKGIYNERD